MSSRGINLERVVEFFKNSNLDVAEITLMHVTNIVGKRRAKENESGERQARVADVVARKKSRKRASLSTVSQSSLPSQETESLKTA